MAVIMCREVIVPVSGLLASDVEIGTSVFLPKSGTKEEFLVVQQGKPSNLYDDSCDGTWLLRKDLYTTASPGSYNTYPYTGIHTACTEYFTSLDAGVRELVLPAIIPFNAGSNGTTYGWSNYQTYSGASGLKCQCFSLSAQEVGFPNSIDAYLTVDGAPLAYFAENSNSKRVAHLNGAATIWYTRTPSQRGQNFLAIVWSSGEYDANRSGTYGIRPAIILPKGVRLDESTMIPKGVS